MIMVIEEFPSKHILHNKGYFKTDVDFKSLINGTLFCGNKLYSNCYSLTIICVVMKLCQKMW